MGEEEPCPYSSFTNKFIISWSHFKVTVCAMIISATTEQHRLHKHHSGETIGNCEQLCQTTYYYLPGHSLVSTAAYLALPFVLSSLMPLYSSVCLSSTNHKPLFQISKATNNIHLFLSCGAFVSPKDFIVRYFVF